MAQVARQQETSVERMIRLAEKARTEGVQLFYKTSTGEYVATSGTQAGKRYEVSPHACTCKGHERFGYCKHRSALLAALGFLPRPGATPVTPAPAQEPCQSCHGRGFWIRARKVGHHRYERYEQVCPHCHGDGITGKVAA